MACQVYVPGQSYPMMFTQVRDAGWSRDAAVLHFLLDGRPYELANILAGGAAYMYNLTEASLKVPELMCPGTDTSGTRQTPL